MNLENKRIMIEILGLLSLLILPLVAIERNRKHLLIWRFIGIIFIISLLILA